MGTWNQGDTRPWPKPPRGMQIARRTATASGSWRGSRGSRSSPRPCCLPPSARCWPRSQPTRPSCTASPTARCSPPWQASTSSSRAARVATSSSPPTGRGPASWPCSCCCPASSCSRRCSRSHFPWCSSSRLWAVFGASGAYFSCVWADVRTSLGEERIRAANLWSFGLAGCIVAGVLGHARPHRSSRRSCCSARAPSRCSRPPRPARPSSRASATSAGWRRRAVYSPNGSYIMLVDGMMCGVIARARRRAHQQGRPAAHHHGRGVRLRRAHIPAPRAGKAPRLLAMGKGAARALALPRVRAHPLRVPAGALEHRRRAAALRHPVPAGLHERHGAVAARHAAVHLAVLLLRARALLHRPRPGARLVRRRVRGHGLRQGLAHRGGHGPHHAGVCLHRGRHRQARPVCHRGRGARARRGASRPDGRARVQTPRRWSSSTTSTDAPRRRAPST